MTARLIRRSTDGLGVRMWWYDNDCRIRHVPAAYRTNGTGWWAEHALTSAGYHQGEVDVRPCRSWRAARVFVASVP